MTEHGTTAETSDAASRWRALLLVRSPMHDRPGRASGVSRRIPHATRAGADSAAGHRRGAVLAVAAAPEQVIPVRRGRVAAQSRERIAGRSALLRVIIDLDGPRPAIVTACRTTRVAKYWSTE